MATVSIARKPFPFSPGFLAWMGLVMFLLGIGLVTAYQVFSKGLVITNMYDSVPWGLWITIDLSAIALGAGAFTLSAVVYLFGLKKFQPSRAPGSLPGVHRVHRCLADPGDGYRSPRPLLAPLGVLECPLSAVGDHLVHHDLPDHHGDGVFPGDHREQVFRPNALDACLCPGTP